MLLLTGYKSKKELKSCIGTRLKYEETSLFGEEYTDNGTFVAAHRPRITGIGGREFFAQITMVDGLITEVK